MPVDRIKIDDALVRVQEGIKRANIAFWLSCAIVLGVIIVHRSGLHQVPAWMAWICASCVPFHWWTVRSMYRTKIKLEFLKLEGRTHV